MRTPLLRQHLLFTTSAGSDVMKRIAAPMIDRSAGFVARQARAAAAQRGKITGWRRVVSSSWKPSSRRGAKPGLGLWDRAVLAGRFSR